MRSEDPEPLQLTNGEVVRSELRQLNLRCRLMYVQRTTEESHRLGTPRDRPESVSSASPIQTTQGGHLRGRNLSESGGIDLRTSYRGRDTEVETDPRSFR